MKLSIIASSNIRKHRSNCIVTGILIACAMLLFYLSLNTIFTISGYADKVNKKQNISDITMFTSYEDRERIESFLKEQKEISEYEIRDLYGAGVSYRNITKNTKDKKIEMRIMNYNEESKLSKLIIHDKQGEIKENSIILPMYLKVSSGYHVGDKVEIEYISKKVEYEVYGFTEDIMFPNPNTVGFFECMVPQKEFERLGEYGCLAGHGYFVNTTQEHPSEYCSDFNKEITKAIPDIASAIMLYTNDSESMCYAASVWAYIIMAMFAVFAIFLIVIAVIVTRFTIITTIEENMPNIGILEAGGYTTKQIILANFMEYCGCAIIGILVGIVGSVGVKGLIEQVISSVTGLLYTSEFNLRIALICASMLLLLVIVTTYVASIRLKKITPLDALRDGVNSHNFKKNHIPLETSKIPLNTAIGFKNIVRDLRQNISISIIVGLLMFVTSVLFNVYYNMSVNKDGIVQLVGLEKCDILYEIHDPKQSSIQLKTTESGKKIVDYDAMCQEISKVQGINRVIPKGDVSALVTNEDKNIQITLSAYQNFEELRIDTIVDGRYPEAENEIVISTRSAKNLGIKIGDVVYVETTDKPLDFVVVGVDQHLYNVGTGGFVSFKGLERINKEFQVHEVYIYIDKNTDINSIIASLKDKFNDTQSNIADYDQYFASVISTFDSAMSSICLFSIVTTGLVVCLIIYLLIKKKILRDRRMLGVYKALGFTTKQLIKQIVLSYIPVIMVGTILGGITACVAGNSIVAGVFNVISGIKKCNFVIMYSYIAFVGVIILGVSTIIAILCSAKIRKIEPCKMIQE